MSRPNAGRTRDRKPRRLNSFSIYIVETWEAVQQNGIAVLPFTDKVRAKSFRYEAYHYRTALQYYDFPKFSLIQHFKVLLRENAKVDMEPRHDERKYPWLIIIMSDEEAFAAATKAAGIEVE